MARVAVGDRRGCGADCAVLGPAVAGGHANRRGHVLVLLPAEDVSGRRAETRGVPAVEPSRRGRVSDRGREPDGGLVSPNAAAVPVFGGRCRLLREPDIALHHCVRRDVGRGAEVWVVVGECGPGRFDLRVWLVRPSHLSGVGHHWRGVLAVVRVAGGGVADDGEPSDAVVARCGVRLVPAGRTLSSGIYYDAGAVGLRTLEIGMERRRLECRLFLRKRTLFFGEKGDSGLVRRRPALRVSPGRCATRPDAGADDA